jgi:hypothetical protein
MNTTQVTVRNVDSLLKQRIARGAKLKDQSINDWVLDAMRTKAGFVNKSVRNDPSWRKFVGAIPQDGFSQDVLADMENIDPQMWDLELNSTK